MVGKGACGVGVYVGCIEYQHDHRWRRLGRAYVTQSAETKPCAASSGWMELALVAGDLPPAYMFPLLPHHRFPSTIVHHVVRRDESDTPYTWPGRITVPSTRLNRSPLALGSDRSPVQFDTPRVPLPTAQWVRVSSPRPVLKREHHLHARRRRRRRRRR